MATNYDINYNDKRFTEVEADKKAALSEVEKTYGGMISNSDKYYNQQINASKDWANKQTELQNAKTDFAIDEINQQKEQAKKDYTREQSGAYVDWQKQSNQYGANAEQMAAQGMGNTGYSESAQVSMFNTYQNRVMAARETYQLAVQNYNNAITEARLQNNSALAEIAYEALQKQLELSLAGFQYKNQLIIEKANKKTELDQMYHNRYQDVLKQINTENALAEEVRQYNEKMAEEKRQYNKSYQLEVSKLAEEKRQFNEQMAYQKAKDAKASALSAAAKSASTGAKIGASKKKSSSSSSSKGSSSSSVKKTSSKTSSSKKSSSGGSTVDMKSVLALGYGPISESKLADLVDKGIAIPYEENGKIKFKKGFGG